MMSQKISRHFLKVLKMAIGLSGVKIRSVITRMINKIKSGLFDQVYEYRPNWMV